MVRVPVARGARTKTLQVARLRQGGKFHLCTQIGLTISTIITITDWLTDWLTIDTPFLANMRWEYFSFNIWTPYFHCLAHSAMTNQNEPSLSLPRLIGQFCNSCNVSWVNERVTFGSFLNIAIGVNMTVLKQVIWGCTLQMGGENPRRWVTEKVTLGSWCCCGESGSPVLSVGPRRASRGGRDVDEYDLHYWNAPPRHKNPPPPHLVSKRNKVALRSHSGHWLLSHF